MQHVACEDQAVEQVRRVQRGVRRLVDGFMQQLQTVEALAGAPEADREVLAGKMHSARSALLEEYWRVERQSTELSRLYAASCRLHGAGGDFGSVLETIRQVAGDLLGCSRIAVYKLEPGSRNLSLVAAWRVPGNPPARPDVGSGPLGHAAASGSPWLLDSPPSPVALGGAPLWAAVPLLGSGRVNAVLALLDQPAPTVDPEQAFELLRVHGGAALEAVPPSRRSRELMAV